MKKVYLSPEISDIILETEDIVTASASLIGGDHHAGGASATVSETAWREELSTGL